ncbi:MAG TPA: hypothetical protein PK830_04385 [Candidatus Atribacteria bacterium]|nr:hypothetical protein [Candidatus Atribacteria bacterium]HPT78323.1 hypothetical protein [Candidatus Atribacteria bacterium]
MRPTHYEEDDFLVIDASLDHSIFPKGITHGIDALATGVYDNYSFVDGYADYPEIDYKEFIDHP